MNDRILKILNEKAADLVKNQSPKEVWRVRIDGVFVTMASGKSSWKAIGHAKNALRHEFYSAAHECISEIWEVPDIGSREARQIFERIWEEFLDSRVEFLKV